MRAIAIIVTMMALSLIGEAGAQEEPTPLPGPVYDELLADWLETHERVVADCEAGVLPGFICDTVITVEEWRARHQAERAGEDAPEHIEEAALTEPVMASGEIIEASSVYADEFWSWIPE